MVLFTFNNIKYNILRLNKSNQIWFFADLNFYLNQLDDR